MQLLKLNLGCCDRKLEGFVGVDIAEPADMIVDLAGPWPWDDSTVDEVVALDVIEHIGPKLSRSGHISAIAPYPYTDRTPFVDNGRIHFMNELWRVLKPGAQATIETPNAARGVGYLQDPTHVSPWCMSTFKYFEKGAFAHTRLSKPYGITAAFRILSMKEEPSPAEGFGEQVWKIKVVLEAVK